MTRHHQRTTALAAHLGHATRASVTTLAGLVMGLGLGLAGGCALQYVVPDPDGDQDQCGPGEVECDGTCIDTDLDPDHCGACTNACVDDEMCVDGTCVEPMPCALDACDDACVDTQTDPANCGMCGRWCDSSAACIAGACVVTCSESCDSDAELCIDGTCVCRAGLDRCDDDCVDLGSDDDHCGMCGRECQDMLCSAGECASACGSGLETCDEACVDFASDPLNCGACERACHPSQECVAGECESP